ncbi:MAG: fimbrillin family protein [Tannerellaceae bacterium]|nr:fimbrillin family protein [Tannerellaceae bacterium]
MELIFHHKLSKITFKILQEGDRNLSGLSSIDILNVATTTQIDITTGDLTTVDNQSTSTIQAYGISGSTDKELTDGAALIVPQQFPAHQELIRVTIGDRVHTYIPDAIIVFEEEVHYNFKIKVYDENVTFEVSRQDWDKDPDHI